MCIRDSVRTESLENKPGSKIQCILLLDHECRMIGNRLLLVQILARDHQDPPVNAQHVDVMPVQLSLIHISL